MAFATERIPTRAPQMLVTLLTIVAAAAVGFFSSVQLSNGGLPVASWSGDGVLAFAALGAVVAVPLAFWATNLGERPLHQQERLAPV